MKRKLISSDEAVPAARQMTEPCSDCPFARDALPGWLGSISVTEWLRAVHGESLIECHVTTNAQCAGAAIYRANVAKKCWDKAILKLQSDRERVFASPVEFSEHHGGGSKVKLYP